MRQGQAALGSRPTPRANPPPSSPTEALCPRPKAKDRHSVSAASAHNRKQSTINFDESLDKLPQPSLERFKFSAENRPMMMMRWPSERLDDDGVHARISRNLIPALNRACLRLAPAFSPAPAHAARPLFRATTLPPPAAPPCPRPAYPPTPTPSACPASPSPSSGTASCELRSMSRLLSCASAEMRTRPFFRMYRPTASSSSCET